MHTYATWEIVCASIACALLLLYPLAVNRRGSAIGHFQHRVHPLYNAIHDQRKSTNNITAFQNMRNLSSITTQFCMVSLTIAVALGRVGSTNEDLWSEMMIVVILWSLVFINYGLAGNAVQYLILNVGLYSEDKVEGIPREVLEHSWARSNRQLAVISRHVEWGERSLFWAIPASFILLHPVLFLIVTVVTLYAWRYFDTRFGVALGNAKVEGIR
jgi:uncharacterized membrane protein